MISPPSSQSPNLFFMFVLRRSSQSLVQSCVKSSQAPHFYTVKGNSLVLDFTSLSTPTVLHCCNALAKATPVLPQCGHAVPPTCPLCHYLCLECSLPHTRNSLEPFCTANTYLFFKTQNIYC